MQSIFDYLLLLYKFGLDSVKKKKKKKEREKLV